MRDQSNPNDVAQTYSWHQDDIEQRLGFRGAAHTRANGVLAFILGCGLTTLFYGAMLPFEYSYIASMFTRRGPTPYFISLLFFWSIAILCIKWRKLTYQKIALTLRVVPDDAGFALSPATADQILDRIHASVDDPRCFLVFNRIVIALSHLRNLKRASDIEGILRSQAEQEESAMETSYALIRGFIWAIPVLGFIGTVLGLSQAIGGFGAVLGQTSDMQTIVSALRTVTAGLATAFETTLLALVAALVLQLCATFLRKSEEEFLDACSDYCLRHILSRLKVIPYETEAS